ncbi:MAG: glycosyltransferase, partial [Desulfobacteraceae bacterium]|nr:glycosyltransferase [Desulfobacteraceae bacterium]
MISLPPVSVVMNAYNKEEYIGQTIESILGQTFGDFEFIIVNDGSTDNTSEVIAKYKDSRIRVFHHENRGIRATLNRGFGEAGGKYIAHIDADDVATPNRLQVQFDFMEKHPDHVLIGCWCKVLNENNDIVELWCPPMDDMGIRWAQLFDNVLGHSGFFIRREIMDGEEWYKTPYAEEYDLAVRLSQKGKLACIPEVLVIYRDLVEGGITDTKWSQQKGFSEKISMAQLADMMKEDVVTPEQRYAVWKLIYRPWLIEEPQTSLAVETLKKIAV